MFFFKKESKNFLSLAKPNRMGRSPNDQKFFASFFQKRSASVDVGMSPIKSQSG
jgi:hypothetical protein